MFDRSLLRALSTSILAGEPSVDGIIARGSQTLGRRRRWLQPLAKRYVAFFSGRVRPRQREVVRFLLADRGFRTALLKHGDELSVHKWLTDAAQMQPVRGAQEWNLPAIESPGALAKWLELTAGELRWFADLKGLIAKADDPRLHHYCYRVLAKQGGYVRLIEAPKPRLKEIQRQILEQVLEKIPAHPAGHGFVKGRSIKTFVAPHAGRRIILRMDLRDFFPSISGVRIQSFFRTLGYPEPVADLLGGICTNSAPRAAWAEPGGDIDRGGLRTAQELYARPHLPQGAPTSPALANLCAYHVDCRLEGLAESMGARFTRYADDLAFSSDEADFERRVDRFSIHVAAILMEEGFTVHHRKTRVMRRGVRQYLAGVVVNQHLNVIRSDFDRLKAVITNCVRFGPESQNREAHPRFRSHLEGRVGFVEMINPSRGKKLRAILDKVVW